MSTLPGINTGPVFSILGLVLQYSLLILIYYFVYRMVQFGYRDLNGRFDKQSAKTKFTASASEAKLTVLTGEGEMTGQEEYVISDSLTVGRSPGNTIVLTNSFVSYEHAVISRRQAQYVLTDLNSTNGTFVNGDRIQGDYILSQDDEIRIGIATFRFER